MKNLRFRFLHLFIFPWVLAWGMLGAGCASTEEPSASSTAILVWANEALLTTFTYSYVNYQEQLQIASHYFTARAWKNYISALETSENLKEIANKKLVASGVAQGAALILDQSILHGQYRWRIQIPMLITLENAHIHREQQVIVTLLVVKTNDQNNVRGLAIDAISILPRIKEKR